MLPSSRPNTKITSASKQNEKKFVKQWAANLDRDASIQIRLFQNLQGDATLRLHVMANTPEHVAFFTEMLGKSTLGTFEKGADNTITSGTFSLNKEYDRLTSQQTEQLKTAVDTLVANLRNRANNPQQIKMAFQGLDSGKRRNLPGH